MSVDFSDGKLGASFKEAVIVLEALQKTKFKNKDKEKVRESMINYIESKLWAVYPYDSEQYFLPNPNPRPKGK